MTCATRLTCASLALVLGVGQVKGQTPRLQTLKDISVGVGEHLPSGFTGVGARAMGMGGAQIAGVLDGSALYWNPAALTRVRRVELLGGLTHGRPEASASVAMPTPGQAVLTNASTATTALNAAVVTVPYQVYRGGLTFAFGVTRPDDFGYRARRNGPVPLGMSVLDTAGQAHGYDQQDEVRQSGSLSQYAMGMGVEVSPSISLGFSVIWHHGNAKVTRNVSLLARAGTPPDSLTGTYRQSNGMSGVSLAIGTAARLPYGFSFGAVALPPVTYELEGTWGDEYAEAIGQNVFLYDYQEHRLKYRIRSPWQLGVGLTWATYALSLGTDLWYTDWRQARYSGSPYGRKSSINAETFFEDRYRQRLRWHIGGELLVPWVSAYLRGGFYYDPDPFRGPVLDTGESVITRHAGRYYTLGAGWLFENALSLDAAFVYGGDRLSIGSVTEDRKTRRFFLTFGFRL